MKQIVVKDKNITKIYGYAKGCFFVIAEDDLAGVWDFQKIHAEAEVDFILQGSHYHLEENEIFFIDTKEEGEKLLHSFMDMMENTTIASRITKDAMENLEAIFVFLKQDGKYHLYIQRIMPRYRIKRNCISFHNGACIEKNVVNITINNKVDIYWNQTNDKIYFYNFIDLEKVFTGFSKFYRVATLEDFNKLIGNYAEFIDVNENLFKELTKSHLKDLAQIVDALDKSNLDIKKYIEYANKYLPHKMHNDKFMLYTKESIKDLKDVIFERFYTAEIRAKESRRVNSFISVKWGAK